MMAGLAAALVWVISVLISAGTSVLVSASLPPYVVTPAVCHSGQVVTLRGINLLRIVLDSASCRADCALHIHDNRHNSLIRLSWLAFRLPPGDPGPDPGDCPHGSVQIVDGVTQVAVTAPLCGQVAPPRVETSHLTHLVIHFQLPNATDGCEFSLEYRRVGVYLPVTTTASGPASPAKKSTGRFVAVLLAVLLPVLLLPLLGWLVCGCLAAPASPPLASVPILGRTVLFLRRIYLRPRPVPRLRPVLRFRPVLRLRLRPRPLPPRPRRRMVLRYRSAAPLAPLVYRPPPELETQSALTHFGLEQAPVGGRPVVADVDTQSATAIFGPET